MADTASIARPDDGRISQYGPQARSHGRGSLPSANARRSWSTEVVVMMSRPAGCGMPAADFRSFANIPTDAARRRPAGLRRVHREPAESPLVQSRCRVCGRPCGRVHRWRARVRRRGPQRRGIRAGRRTRDGGQTCRLLRRRDARRLGCRHAQGEVSTLSIGVIRPRPQPTGAAIAPRPSPRSPAGRCPWRICSGDYVERVSAASSSSQLFRHWRAFPAPPALRAPHPASVALHAIDRPARRPDPLV